MEARFVQPATTRRPAKSRRFDVFGLKANRSLTLFNSGPLQAWLTLESTPAVTWYCERPLVIDEGDRQRVADFYAIRDGKEELLFCATKVELEAGDACLASWPGLTNWCAHNQISIRFAPMFAREDCIARANWEQIVRELSAFRRYASPDLIAAVRSELGIPKSIDELCMLFQQTDPIVVKVAVFQLVHHGLAISTDLDRAPISTAMIFSAP
jgi:hypothetical protein